MSTDGTVRGRETWQIAKPSVTGSGGMVTSQHYLASEIGARVLAEGGNAVDAAVAAGLAIGTVEPWMSGLGGCGQMLICRAGADRATVVDFGLRSSQAIDPDAYPLVAGIGTDLFSWPAVVDDRNVWGPGSAAVPTYLAGVATALERFGTWELPRVLEPAIASAEAGMPVDWYATLKIASAATKLARFEESRRVYLPEGQPPAGEWGGPLPRIRLGRLAGTLRRIAEVGPRDFYEGELSRAVLADCAGVGIAMTAEDLASYRPRVVDALSLSYRGRRLFAAPGLTAGPTLSRALGLLEAASLEPRAPGVGAYASYAAALTTAYAERLETLGDHDSLTSPSSTTHLSVVDREGNAVALTQTLLSLFGSRVMLPETGILMNNGMMWFDPRPGRPNSIGAGKRPLSNMCPAVLERGPGERYALGASGGRKIMPAVFQLISFLIDYGMTLDEAFHQPRIDVSGGPALFADASLPRAVLEDLATRYPLECWQHGVYPVMYACPNAAGSLPGGAGQVGNAFVMSPWSSACAVSSLTV